MEIWKTHFHSSGTVGWNSGNVWIYTSVILKQTGKGGCMKYKHIVFDIDGTLIDTEYAVLHSLQETIRAISGREMPCPELKFALGITGIDALKNLR